jgi:ABC-type multidrug transport system fused ATPase/permease subunit
MNALKQLFQYIKNYKRYVALNIICNILMVLFNIVSIPMLIPFLQILLGQTIPPIQKPDFQWTIDAIKNYFNWYLGDLIAQSGSKEQALIFVCIVLILAFFFKNLFRYLALFFMTPLRNGVVRDIRKALFEKILRLPLSYFSDERKGDLISRVSNDVLEVEWSILNVIETVVREPLLIFGAIGMMIYISPALTLFVVVLIVFTAVIIGSIGRTLKKDSAITQQKMGNLMSVLDETLGGMRVIKGFNAENYQKEKFSKENNDFRKAMTKGLRKRDLSSPLTEFLGITVVCVLIWFGFKQVEVNALTPASFIAFLYAFFTVIEPAKAFSNAYYHLQRGKAALDRINFILDAEELIKDEPQSDPLPESIGISPSLNSIEGISDDVNSNFKFQEKIEYRNVGFYYNEEDKVILKNINLTIKKGKVIALVGASGAGKSTLADLLPRFYDVSEGEILIDGLNIKDLRLKNLRNIMGIVTQEAVLFNDTIYNNIVFGLENITEQQVIAAAKAANAHEFIENAEEKYQTNIGDRGNKLSGGQRQRLTIARALLRNPEILILDEATSALDSESEKLVQSALAELMKNRTAIVIAHRLSTVQHADEIIVLRAGQIIERGTHESLLVLNGEYRKLVELQGLA